MCDDFHHGRSFWLYPIKALSKMFFFISKIWTYIFNLFMVKNLSNTFNFILHMRKTPSLQVGEEVNFTNG